MSDGWLSPEKYEHTPILGCTGPGTMAGSGFRWKVVLHTTESRPGSIDAVTNLFASKPCYTPQFALDVSTGRRVQYIPWSWSGAALKGCDRGSQTNKGRAVQVELVGFAKDTGSWPDEWLWVIADWLADLILDGVPINLDNIFDFQGMRGTLAVSNSPYRQSESEWAQEDGISGHVRVHCTTPETPILCADLAWRSAGDLYPDDEVVAFDEHSPGGSGRRFRTAKVIDNIATSKPCVRVVTDMGEVTCSTDHLWLLRLAGSKPTWKWARADEVCIGDEIGHLVEPWCEDNSRSAGWLAGLYDADGCFVVANPERTDRASRNVMLAFDQLSGELLADFDNEMLRRGFDVWKYERAQTFKDGYERPNMQTRRIQDRRSIMRALGSIRPTRLLRNPNLRQLWEGAMLGKIAQTATVRSVESAGLREVAAVSTTTRTLIAGGLLSHNCNDHWDPGAINAFRVAEIAKEILGGSYRGPTGPSSSGGSGDIGAVRSEYMQIGMEGGIVKFAQELLIGLGCDCGPDGADGIFGADTESCVRAFQAANGLDPDGVIGPLTQAAVAAAYGRGGGVPSADAPAFPGRYLLVVDPMLEGEDVRQWQQQMSDRGWPGVVDGVYGPKSERQCTQFETEKLLQVDGVVGPMVWNATWSAPIT